jgi:hypothetical protein
MDSPWIEVNGSAAGGDTTMTTVEDPDCVMKSGQQNAEYRKELHRVLHSIQSSPDYGIYVCESFKDPRRQCIDEYWEEVAQEALGLQHLHRLIGTGQGPLTDDACRALHRLSRLLARLSQRIDRVVLMAPSPPPPPPIL